MMNIWQSVTGMITVELTSASPKEHLREICRQGIAAYGIRKHSNLTVSFQIRRKDYSVLSVIAEKNGDRLQILSRKGMYWNLLGLLGRPALVAGIAFTLLLACLLPTRVLIIQVRGNQMVSAKQILDAADACGVQFGASRRNIRNEKVKNGLLSMIPELQWVGVNTKGCLAVISVEEREPSIPKKSTAAISNIVAALDGVVVSCTVTKGQGNCIIGQAVRKGDVLISGLTDCGGTYLAGQASGEIVARTQHFFSSMIPVNREYRMQETGRTRRYSLIFQKKKINFSKGSGIYPPGCDKMYKEYYMTLPGGFRLPLRLLEETIVSYDTCAQSAESAFDPAYLESYSENYLLEHMVSGVVESKSEKITRRDGVIQSAGVYNCREMIGREIPETLGEYNHEAS